MKTQNFVLVPIAFAAGIASIVVLEYTGLVSINQVNRAGQTGPQAQVADQQDVSSSEITDPQTTEISSQPVAKPSEDAALSGTHITERIDQLQQQLRSATVQADKMQSRIITLEEQIETASIGNEFLPDGNSLSAISGEALAQQTDEAGVRANVRAGFGGPDNDVQYTSLVSAGVDPLVAEQIQQRNDQWTLQRLELVDQATREGWRRSEQFDERLNALREERPSIREELGDSAYEKYLIVSGETNQVQIASIINGSAAQLAGLENGDVVLSYANQRMFTLRELQQATREGSRGEPIQVEVLRSGEQIIVELPRGPLGVTLTGKREAPSAF